MSAGRHPAPAKRPARSKAKAKPAAATGAPAATPAASAATAEPGTIIQGGGLALPVSTSPAAVLGAGFGSAVVDAGPSGSVSPRSQRPPSTLRPVPSRSEWSLTPALAFLAPLSPGVGVAALQAAPHTPVPFVLAGIVIFLLIVQTQIDKRDPKMALAPTHRGDDGMTFK